jgi:hypothetical protein
MSNLTRFYWAKLQGTSNVLQKHKTEDDLEKVQDICCQLISESQCPPLCQIEAWVSSVTAQYVEVSTDLRQKLRSQCYPHNYWFAKAQLDRALETITKCEKWEDASDRAFAALKESKQTVIDMLQHRTSKYQQEWKAKGRDVPPSEDEWYTIVETESSKPEPIFEFIGKPFKGSDWPFEAQAGKLLMSDHFPTC